MIEKKPAYVDFSAFQKDALSDDDLLETHYQQSDLEEVGGEIDDFESGLRMAETEAIAGIQAVASQMEASGQTARNLLVLDGEPGGLADDLSLRSEGF